MNEVTARVRVIGFDHIVLNVADIEASMAFYCGTLGMEPVRLEEWRAGMCRFPSARVSEATIIDFAEAPRSAGNLDHFCLTIEATDLEALVASGELVVDRGPGTRFGAQGNGESFYVRDPDGNRIELRYY
jgi:catechol 2,3-dioxygenase-like lactoylglutathione lyase family enzyme